MPILYINGISQAPDRDPRAAFACEWCGESLAARPLADSALNEDQARFLTHPPMGGREDEREWGKGAVFLVRLCKGCIHIIGVMGDAGIRETSSGPEFPSDDDPPTLIQVRNSH